MAACQGGRLVVHFTNRKNAPSFFFHMTRGATSKLVDGLLRRYGSVLKKTFSIIVDLEGHTLNPDPEFTAKISRARDLLNEAQFRASTIGAAIDASMEALMIVHDAALSAAAALNS